LHLTTGRYYTPSGHSIQARGIIPDIQVAQGDETAASKEANLRKHLAGEAAAEQISAPVIKPDPKKTYDDFQLSYAKDLLRGISGGAVSQR
jgi:carboxyl-terminal processing protease